MKQLFALCFLISLVENAISSKGCVPLDTYSFDKIVNKFPVSLIKFDTAYPYGAKHDAFENVCQSAHSSAELLVAEVQVKDYGEKENSDIAKRFGLETIDFPIVQLFMEHKTPITFKATDEDFTAENLKQFIRLHSEIYIGLPGCLKTFDLLLLPEFLEGSEEVKNEVVKKAEDLIDAIKTPREQKSAQFYIKIMHKIIEKGIDFIKKEITRIQNVLKGKLMKDKQAELQDKLNILKSFTITRHDEL